MTRLLGTFLFATLAGLIVNAQQSLPDEEIEVLKNFEAKLLEVQKIFLGPKSLTIDSTARVYEYQVNISPLDIQYPPPYIRPRAMSPEEGHKTGYGFIKGGYGNLQNPLGIVRLNKSVENYYNVGLKFDYLAFEDDITTNKAYKDYYGGVDIDYFITESTMANINLRGGKEKIHLYGFNRGLRLDDLSDSTRTYSRLGISLGLVNEREIADDEFEIEGGINYDYLHSDEMSIKEHNLGFEAGLTKSISSNSQFNLIADAEFTFLQDTITREDHDVSLGASVDIASSFLSLHLGGVANKDHEGWRAFPDIELNGQLIENALYFRLGARGDTRINSLTNIVEFMPFFNQQIDTLTATIRYDFYAGFHVKAGPNVNIHLDGGYLLQDDYALFLNDPANPRQFRILYDDIDEIYVDAHISYDLRQDIQLGISGGYRHFSQSTGEVWNIPQYKTRVYGNFRFFDQQLIVVPEFYLKDKVPYLDLNGQAAQSDFFTDLNLELRYDVADNFGLFIEGKNLGNSLSERWFGYEPLSRHFVAGAYLRF